MSSKLIYQKVKDIGVLATFFPIDPTRPLTWKEFESSLCSLDDVWILIKFERTERFLRFRSMPLNQTKYCHHARTAVVLLYCFATLLNIPHPGVFYNLDKNRNNSGVIHAG